MATFRYSCVLVQHTGARPLVLFAAPATDVEQWIGVPQRLIIQGEESAGFQRTVTQARQDALRDFFGEPKNVMQNPLLCAIRQREGVQVTFEPTVVGGKTGELVISAPDFKFLALGKLFSLALEYLEARDPSLLRREEPEALIERLRLKVRAELSGTTDGLEDEDVDDDELDEESEDSGELAEEALFDESQIGPFWDQLKAREVLAEELPDVDTLLGFTRDMLVQYLQPIILVDGQHRLRGAVEAARQALGADAEATQAAYDGNYSNELKATRLTQLSRTLPMSLLLDDSPAEHVFQYVLVNQKATPVPRALLGTIISTSLAQSELADIAQRLEQSGIPLEGSRIVSILSRQEDSPFAGLVAKGLNEEGNDKLPWTVISSLADIFRDLKGARLYHDPSIDNARAWAVRFLEESPIVADWNTAGFKSPLDYWRDLNGPWMKVFKAFFTTVRKKLAADEGRFAEWRDPRKSNLFNKPSLHILASDFFDYLLNRREKLESAEAIPALVDDWLAYVEPKYFARDWKLDGVKKDSVGTRRQWSKLWKDYRVGIRPLPSPGDFKIIRRS